MLICEVDDFILASISIASLTKPRRADDVTTVWVDWGVLSSISIAVFRAADVITVSGVDDVVV